MKLRSAWRTTISTMMSDEEIYITNEELRTHPKDYAGYKLQRVFIMTNTVFNSGESSSLFPPF